MSSLQRKFQILCPSWDRFPSQSIIPPGVTTCRMATFHKVKSLLGGCSFGKFNFHHFSSVLRHTSYFISSIFPDALRMSNSNSTWMWMRTLLSRLNSSSKNLQRRNSLINHLSPQQGSSNRILLNSSIQPITFLPDIFRPAWWHPLFVLLVWLLQGLQWDSQFQKYILQRYPHLQTKVWWTSIVHKHFIVLFNKSFHFNMWATNSI